MPARLNHQKANKKTKSRTRDPNKPIRPSEYKRTHEALQLIKGISANSLCKESFLWPGTVSKLRRAPKDGGTRHPQATTLDEIFRLAGYKQILVPLSSAEIVPLAPKSSHKSRSNVVPLQAGQGIRRRAVGSR